MFESVKRSIFVGLERNEGMKRSGIICVREVAYMKFSSEAVSSEYIDINACGVQHLFGSDFGSTRLRGRADYHLIYIPEGVCRVVIEGKERVVGGGNIIIFLPYEPQIYKFPAESHSRSYFIHFSGSACGKMIEKFDISEDRVFYVGKSQVLEERLLEMIDTFRLKLPHFRDICEGQLISILSLFAQQYVMCAAERHIEESHRIADVCRQMHQSFDKNLPISHYANMCNLSESRFSHFFKEQIGISPMQYLTNIRLEKATEYLETSDISILEVSERLGFQNQSYFCRFFKMHTGISPIKFRNK